MTYFKNINSIEELKKLTTLTTAETLKQWQKSIMNMPSDLMN